MWDGVCVPKQQMLETCTHPHGGQPGLVLVCDTPQPPPPPRVLKEIVVSGPWHQWRRIFFVHASLSSNHPCFERHISKMGR